MSGRTAGKQGRGTGAGGRPQWAGRSRGHAGEMEMEEQRLKDTADTLQGWGIRLTAADPRLSAQGFLIGLGTWEFTVKVLISGACVTTCSDRGDGI